MQDDRVRLVPADIILFNDDITLSTRPDFDLFHSTFHLSLLLSGNKAVA